MTASPHDAAVRQQIYLEGVKSYEADGIDTANSDILTLIIAMLAAYGYNALGDMPKKVLVKFIAEFNARAYSITGKFTNQLILSQKNLVSIDNKLSSSVFSKLTGNTPNLGGTTKIWSGVTNDIISGTGHLPLQMIKDFFRSVVGQFNLLFRRSYAEGWTAQQLITNIQGTRTLNYKDGLLRKVANQYATVQNTLIQHLHSFVTFNIGSLFYYNYQWISVLDSHTTAICQSRANKVFRYSDGPRPPAHYNCRSTIVALETIAPVPSPNRYYDWLVKQPIDFQDDIMGTARAQALRAGRLGPKDIPIFGGTKKITPKEFGQKQPLILA